MIGLRPSPFFFTDTVSVNRFRTVESGNSGLGFPVDEARGRADDWMTPVGLSGLSVSIQPNGGGAAQNFGQRVLESPYMVFFQDVPASPIQRDDRLTDQSGAKYIVESVNDEALQGRVYVVGCRRLD